MSVNEARNAANIRKAKRRARLLVGIGLAIMIATLICLRMGVNLHGIPATSIAWICVTQGLYWCGRRDGIKSTLEESS